MQRYAKFLIKQNKYVYTYKKKKNTSSSAIFAFRKNKQQSSQIKKETLGMTVMKRKNLLCKHNLCRHTQHFIQTAGNVETHRSATMKQVTEGRSTDTYHLSSFLLLQPTLFHLSQNGISMKWLGQVKLLLQLTLEEHD